MNTYSFPQPGTAVLDETASAAVGLQAPPAAGGTHTPSPAPHGPWQPAMPHPWHLLPWELRQRPQWCLAARNSVGEFKVPSYVDNSGRLRFASHSDPHTWMDFDYALSCAHEFGLGLGYCLHPEDPFGCVDFDVKNQHNRPNEPDTWTPAIHLEYMRRLVEDLDSYTELSQSGQGVHVWVRGKIGEGIKRSGVEVYSQWRFMVCTGRIVHDLPINERQVELRLLASAMRAAEDAAEELLDAPQNYSDEKVMHSFWHARNAVKFRALWRGEWRELGYPSQSEADQALMTQLAFYSQCNEQCRRLFRMSALGQRDKAIKDDRYVDLTLRRARATHAPKLAGIAAARTAMAPAIDAALAAWRAKRGAL